MNQRRGMKRDFVDRAAKNLCQQFTLEQGHELRRSARPCPFACSDFDAVVILAPHDPCLDFSGGRFEMT